MPQGQTLSATISDPATSSRFHSSRVVTRLYFSAAACTTLADQAQRLPQAYSNPLSFLLLLQSHKSTHKRRLTCTASASGAAAAAGDDSSSNEPAPVTFSPLEQQIGNICKTLTNFFPLWVVLAAVIGFNHPPLFTWFDDSLVKLSLMFCMLAMGLTLTFQEIAGVFTRAPQLLLLGMVSRWRGEDMDSCQTQQ